MVEIRAGVALGGGEMREIRSGTTVARQWDLSLLGISASDLQGNEIAKYAGGDVAVSCECEKRSVFTSFYEMSDATSDKSCLIYNIPLQSQLACC